MVCRSRAPRFTGRKLECPVGLEIVIAFKYILVLDVRYVKILDRKNTV